MRNTNTSHDPETTPSIAIDPIGYWRTLADGLDPFTVTNPDTEREYAAIMLYCVQRAAVGRLHGPRARPGRKHRDRRNPLPGPTNVPHRSTEPSATAGNRATNRQHDVEAASDAIARAWAQPDRRPDTPLAALAGAYARSFGFRYAQYRTDRTIARTDVDDLPEPVAPEQRGANATAELAAIVERLSPDDRGAWAYAVDCWQARRHGGPQNVPMRSDSALRSLRRLARRALAR